jgi:hypothetical protein
MRTSGMHLKSRCKSKQYMITFDLSLYFGSINVLKGLWDQEKFEDLLAKWIVTTDQLFSTVDKPEFCKLLVYTHHPSPDLKILYCDAVKR